MFTRYVKTQKLGESTYACVFRAEDKQTGEIVAIKQTKMNTEEDGVPASALRETTILRNLHHTNIITLHDVAVENGTLFIVMEFMDKNLCDYLSSHRRIPLEPQILQSYSYQLLSALNYMHSTGYIHRNLNPESVLINKQGILKVCNFRHSQIYHHPMKKSNFDISTRVWYLAPELVAGMDTYDYGIDVWAAGCIMAELCIGFPIFGCNTEEDAIGERLQLFYPLMPLAQDPEYCDKNWDEKHEILRINGWPFNADDTI